MTRIIRKHSTLASRFLSRLVLAALVVGALLLGVSAAHAAFTTPPCLAAKLKATGALRACRAAEGAKQILGKVGISRSVRPSFGTNSPNSTSKPPKRASSAGTGTMMGTAR